MGYRHLLIVRFSRRDRLAIVVIALAVAMVVAGIILAMGMGAHVASIAGGFEPALVVEHGDAPGTATEGSVVIPMATVSVDGKPAIVAGVPEDVDLAGFGGFDPPRNGEVLATHTAGEVSIEGVRGTNEYAATRRVTGGDPFPPDWYLLRTSAVHDLGGDSVEALVLAPAGGLVPADCAAAPGMLSFVAAGTEQLLRLLWIATMGAAVLVGVLTYTIVRMTVMDQQRTLGIVRSTGASPRTVAIALLGRVAILSGIAVALGFSIGVILPNAVLRIGAITGAVSTLPTSIPPEGWLRLATSLGTIYLVAMIAGGVATWTALHRPPSALVRSSARTRLRGRTRRPGTNPSAESGRIPGWVVRWHGGLFGLETFAVALAAVTVFVMFALIIAGSAGAAAPLVAPEGAILIDADAPHPMASSVDESVADAARIQGVTASPEIMTFGVIRGEPVLVRGAEFSSFSTITNAAVRVGSTPVNPDEVMIGTGVAERLGIGPGDRLPLGGGTRVAVTRVTVAGVYDAPGYHADQIIVSLDTARHLSGVPDGMVHLIRFDDDGSSRGTGNLAPTIRGVSVPGRVSAGEPIDVTVTADNPTPHEVDQRVSATLRDGTRRIEIVTTTVTVPPYGITTGTVRIPTKEVGSRTVHIAGEEHAVEVRDPARLSVEWLPAAAPPNASLQLSVIDGGGRPASDVPITVGNVSARTNASGVVRLRLPAEPGLATIAIGVDDTRIEESIVIDPDAGRVLRPRLRIDPANPQIVDRVTARASLTNPWGVPLERSVALRVAEAQTAVSVDVGAGDSVAVPLSVGQQPPGTYEARLDVNGTLRVDRAYEVSGDEGLARLAAGHGRLDDGTGIGQVVDWVIGDLRAMMAALLGVTAAATVAGTVAVFRGGVQRSERTMGVRRATGAGPTWVIVRICREATVIAVPAVGGAIALGTAIVWGIHTLGWTTAFGVSVFARPTAIDTLGLWAGGLVVCIFGAVIAGWVVVTTSPSRLLGRRDR